MSTLQTMLKEWESQNQFVEVTVNGKEETSQDFCPNVQEFGLHPVCVLAFKSFCSWVFLQPAD